MNKDTILSAIGKRFHIDTRSLAVFRVVAGVLILADILSRLRNFHFFYTDQGVVPVSLAMDLAPSNAFSVFYLSGDPTFTMALFVVHFLVGIQLILGYYTRFAIVASFLFVVSVDFRNPIVTSYADILFRHLLFWGMFMPLGARYSVDAIRSDGPPKRVYTGLAAPFVLLQMMFMYFSNGMHKIPYREEWFNGESMLGIMHYDTISFFLGDYIREFPLILQIGGIKWYTLMLGSPMLLLFVGRQRYLLASLYGFGHLVLAVTVRIGAFPYAALMGLMLFCQDEAWSDARYFADRFGIPVDRYVETTTRHGERLEARLPRFALRDRVPPIARIGTSLQVIAVVIILLAGIFMIVPNLQTAGLVDDDEAVPLEDTVGDGQSMFRLTQPDWQYYQGPIRSDQYYVFAGETEDGHRVDIYNDRPLSWDRPYGEQNHKQFETYRHRFYMHTVRQRADDRYDDRVLDHYQDYMCENYRWEDSELKRFNMFYIQERTTIDDVDDYREYSQRTRLIDTHGCGDNEPDDVDVPPIEYTRGIATDRYDEIADPDSDARFIDEFVEDE